MKTLRTLAVAALVWLTAAAAFARQSPTSAFFTASDDVKIHYLTTGTSGS